MKNILLAVVSTLFAINVFAQMDTDGDGVDDAMDNCLLVANSNQTDIDSDNWGNACDPDFNNNGIVNFLDFQMLTDNFLTNETLYDLNDDGSVNFLDIAIFSTYFLQPPGPAGFAISGGGAWCNPLMWSPIGVPTVQTHVIISGSNTSISFCDSGNFEDPPGNIIEVASIHVEGSVVLFSDDEFSSPIHILSDIHIPNGGLGLFGLSSNSDPFVIDGDIVIDTLVSLSDIDVTINGEVNSATQLQGDIILENSILRNAVISLGTFGTIQQSPLSTGSTLDNLTFDGTLDLSDDFLSQGEINIFNGMTLSNATIRLGGGGNGTLNFIGTQSISGLGTIDVSSGSNPGLITVPAPQSVITFEQGVSFDVRDLIVTAIGSELVFNGAVEADALNLTAEKITISSEFELASASQENSDARVIDATVDISSLGALIFVNPFGGFDNAPLVVTGQITNSLGLINAVSSTLEAEGGIINEGAIEVIDGVLKIGNEVDDIWDNSAFGSLFFSNSTIELFATFETAALDHFGSGNEFVVSGKALNQNSNPNDIDGVFTYLTPLEIVGGNFPIVAATFVTPEVIGIESFILDGVSGTASFEIGPDVQVVVRNDLIVGPGAEIISKGAVFEFEEFQTLDSNGQSSITWQSDIPLDNDQVVFLSGAFPGLIVGESVDWVFDLPSATISFDQSELILRNNLSFTANVNAATFSGDSISVFGDLDIQSSTLTVDNAATVTIDTSSIDFSGGGLLEPGAQLILEANSLSRFSTNNSMSISAGALLELNSISNSLNPDSIFIEIGDFGAGRVNYVQIPSSGGFAWTVVLEEGFTPTECDFYSVVTHPTINPIFGFIDLNFFEDPSMFSFVENQSTNAYEIGVGPVGSCQ